MFFTVQGPNGAAVTGSPGARRFGLFARTFSWGLLLGLSALASLCVSPLSAAQAAYPTWLSYAAQPKKPVFRPWNRADSRYPTSRSQNRKGVHAAPAGQAAGRRPYSNRWPRQGVQQTFSPHRAGARKAVPITRGQELGLRFRPDERASPYDRSGFPADGMAPAQDSAELHSQFRPAPRKRKPTYEELQADNLRQQPMPGPVMPYSGMPIPPGPSYRRSWPAW